MIPRALLSGARAYPEQAKARRGGSSAEHPRTVLLIADRQLFNWSPGVPKAHRRSTRDPLPRLKYAEVRDAPQARVSVWARDAWPGFGISKRGQDATRPDQIVKDRAIIYWIMCVVIEYLLENLQSSANPPLRLLNAPPACGKLLTSVHCRSAWVHIPGSRTAHLDGARPGGSGADAPGARIRRCLGGRRDLEFPGA